MKRLLIIGLVLAAASMSGCCWRPWWCNQGYYGGGYAQPAPTYQPMYAPVQGNPCTCQ
jgi:hypothetical protein